VAVGSVVATLVVALARIVVLTLVVVVVPLVVFVLALVVLVFGLGLLDLVFVPVLGLVILFLGVGRVGLPALGVRLLLGGIVGGLSDVILTVGGQLHVGGKDGLRAVVVARGSDSYSGACRHRGCGDKQRDNHEFRLQ
jgi:hypothetical protein